MDWVTKWRGVNGYTIRCTISHDTHEFHVIGGLFALPQSMS